MTGVPGPYPEWLLDVPRDLRRQTTLHAVDTAAGSAPAVTRRDGCLALFDGLLYNRPELERRSRTPVATVADIVLDSYADRREALLDELAGIYSLVVHDERRASLIAARDRVGTYPLFYADVHDGLLLSTSIEAILRDGRVSRDLNRAALADHLAHRWPDPGETYFAAVRRVPPGHALVIDGGLRRVYRYWHPIAAEGPTPWLGPKEVERFEEVLENAIARFLNLGRSGIFLSGGLDSITVAAVATEISRDRREPAPLAFSLGFSEQADEREVQRRVAAGLGLAQVLVPLEDASGGDGVIAGALELHRRWPVPLSNSLWLPAYIHLGWEARERGCEVVLTGHGGDEWLGVSPYYAADLLYARDIRGLFRLWGNFRRSYSIPALRVLQNILWAFGARPLLGVAAERFTPRLKEARRRRLVAATPDWIAPDRDLRQELEQRALSSVRRRKAGQVYLAEINLALDHALISAELEEFFETGRRLGLRLAQPFWDADLLALLCRTPPELLNRHGRSKGLVRDMIARRFPTLGFEAQRKVNASGVARTLVVQDGGRAWRELGGATTLAELGVVDGVRVQRFVDDLLGLPVAPARNVESYRIWDILTLEVWTRSQV